MEYGIAVPREYKHEKVVTLHINKVGGGTVGESYVGNWEYHVMVHDVVVTSGTDLYTGSPHTHEQAAATLAGFMSYYCDDLEPERAEEMQREEPTLYAYVSQENPDRYALFEMEHNGEDDDS